MPAPSCSAATVDRVLAALVREADLDDLVIASDYRIAELVGISHPAADYAIRHLIAEGRIALDGRSSGRGNTRMLRLVDSG